MLTYDCWENENWERERAGELLKQYAPDTRQVQLNIETLLKSRVVRMSHRHSMEWARTRMSRRAAITVPCTPDWWKGIPSDDSPFRDASAAAGGCYWWHTQREGKTQCKWKHTSKSWDDAATPLELSVWTAENPADVFTDLGETAWHHHEPIQMRTWRGCAPAIGRLSSRPCYTIYRNRFFNDEPPLLPKGARSESNALYWRRLESLWEQAGSNPDWVSLNYRWPHCHLHFVPFMKGVRFSKHFLLNVHPSHAPILGRKKNSPILEQKKSCGHD